MWFGTKDGLNKYDGYKFTVYKYDPSNSNSLSDNFITSIIETRDGLLWIGTENGGINSFDPETETFARYLENPEQSNSLNLNSIWTIYEDPDTSSKVLWIGTNGGGLNRFVWGAGEVSDPTNGIFTHYTRNPADSNSLSDNFVRAILKDNTGILWIGTHNGFNRYDPGQGIWFHYYYDPADPQSISNSKAKIVYEDSDGIIWVGTNIGLNRVIQPENSILNPLDRQDSLAFFVYEEDPQHSGFIGINITAICEDQFGMLWVGTNNGVNKLNKETGMSLHYSFDSGNPTSLSGNLINSIYEDRSGLLWFGTDGSGISKLNRSAEYFQHFNHIPGNPNSLSHSSVRGIYEDADGILWVGGYGGLNKINRNSGQVKHYRWSLDFASQQLTSDLIYAIIGDAENDQILWLGTEGDGLYKFDKITEKVEHYTHQPNPADSYANIILSGNFIFDLYDDAKGGLWLATNDGLDRLIKATGEITSYTHDPDDAYSLSDNETRIIYEDRAGILWVGTNTDGLNRFDKKTNRFTRFMHDPGNPLSLSNNRIKSIYEDKNRRLWIGTNGGGLNRFNRETETFRRYTEKDGLPNDVIYGILEDENGNLWLSTNWGLSKFNPETEEFRNYDVNDGLQSNEFNTASYFKSKRGEMFFGGINGFNAFYPAKIKKYPYMPSIVITDFQIFNKSIPIGKMADGRTILQKQISETKEIELSYKDDVFLFEFAALSYVAPGNNKYAYKMEGVDKDWVFTDASRRFATYTHLDPGKYIFRVKGSNHDGVWNEEGTFVGITIIPPIWKTWWAYIVYLIVGFGGIIGFIQWRLMRTRIRTRRLEYMVNERTAKIEQQKKEIETQSGKLVEADKMKSRFFANISHEFRTPLTLIKGPLENLLNQKDGRITKTTLKHLAISHNNVNHLQKLIDELLDLSKLEAGALKLRTTFGDLNGFLRRIVDSFYSAAEKKGINLKLIFDNDRIDLYFDEDKLEKIINNLLSNALKFTTKKSAVIVTVTDATPIDEEQGAGLFVTIRITDTGIGIAPEALPHVFDRFFQVESSKTRKFEGTGIGLALTKELVELHGGEITVESNIGAGTTFMLSLPKGRAHLSDVEVVVKAPGTETGNKPVSGGIVSNDKPEVPEEIIQSGSAPKVLIVEDNAELREYLKDHLMPAFTVFEATNGKEGLEKALEIQPRLIISDIMMPEMDGFEMTRALKQNEATNTIPIILLTARADITDRLAGLETQADDYITKPFNMDEIKIKVSNLITSRQHLRGRFSRNVVMVEVDKLELDSADKIFLEQARDTVLLRLSDQTLNVEALAKSVFLSKRQFDRKIQLLTGMTPAAFIRQLRLKRAKQYLEEKTYWTVAEVAHGVGFNNIKYFSRLYHQTFGQFPSETIRG